MYLCVPSTRQTNTAAPQFYKLSMICTSHKKSQIFNLYSSGIKLLDLLCTQKGDDKHIMCRTKWSLAVIAHTSLLFQEQLLFMWRVLIKMLLYMNLFIKLQHTTHSGKWSAGGNEKRVHINVHFTHEIDITVTCPGNIWLWIMHCI